MFSNAVDVLECLHNPTDPSTERTAPPCSAHVKHIDVPRALDQVEGRGRVQSAQQHGDGDDDVYRCWASPKHYDNTTEVLNCGGGTAHG